MSKEKKPPVTRLGPGGFPVSNLSTSKGAPGPLKVDKPSRVRATFRDNVERAETLSRTLASTIRQEIDRLENERRNDPEQQTLVDFLALVAATLDDITEAISEGRRAPTPKDREQKYRKAESLASDLAKAGRNFAERNYERVIDYAGYSAFAILGTIAFTGLLNVPAQEALAAQLMLLGFFPKKK
jgi:hypothetical protein